MLSNSINAGLQQLMTDQEAFANFASSGAFSGQTILSIPNDVAGLTLALKTYLISASLSGNGFIGLASHSSLDGGYCSNPAVSTYCFDKFTNATTGIEWRFSGTTRKGSTGLYAQFGQAITTNQWTTLSALYQGSWDCASAGFWGQELINYNADGTIDMSCMSQLPECAQLPPYYGQPSTCPTTLVNGGCPIREC